MVNLFKPLLLTRIQRSHNEEKNYLQPIFLLFLSVSRCPSPILHERAGDMQGGDGEMHREREPTLERTRSAGESDDLSSSMIHDYLI